MFPDWFLAVVAIWLFLALPFAANLWAAKAGWYRRNGGGQ